MKFLLPALGAASVMTLAACGGSPPASSSSSPAATPTPIVTAPPSPSPSPTAASPTYTLQVALSGDDPASGSLAVPAANGCVQPSQIAGDFGPDAVGVQINAHPSGSSPAPLSPGDITVTVDSDTWVVASAANAPQPTTGTITLTGTASGVISVQHLYNSSKPNTPSSNEGGTISWTCAP